MKIALIQQTAGPDKIVNREKGLHHMKRAVERGAEVICTAELAFEPFYPQQPATAQELMQAETIPGETTGSILPIWPKN